MFIVLEIVLSQLPVVLGVIALKTVEVLLQTFRTVFVVSGRRLAAGAVALVEASVIIAALGIVLSDLSAPRIIGFVIGMSCGTMAGMEAVYRFRLGIVTVRSFTTPDDADDAAQAIRDLGHGATVFYGEGRDGMVAMILSAVRRRHAASVITAVKSASPQAFATVDNAPAPGSAVGGIVGVRT